MQHPHSTAPPVTPVSHRAPVIALLAGMALCVLVYLPGLSGAFMFDDHWNLLRNPALQMDELTLENLHEAALSGRSGPLKRPLAMVSFAVNYYLAGFDAYYFKLTNLLLHLLNGTLIFFLCRLLLKSGRRSEMVAAAIAALWLVHPLNLTSVLYVVQRMTLLATLFSLAGLLCFTRGRQLFQAQLGGRGLMLSALLLFLPLAALGKEIGLILPVWLLLIEVLLFARPAAPAQKRWLHWYFLLGCVLPALCALALVVANFDVLADAFAMRSFSLGERLLTEARVLWLYVGLVLAPSLSRLGLFHDDIVLSTGLLSPPATLLALIAWIGLIVFVVRLRGQLKFLCFGLLFFLSGHLMESTVLPLDIAFEHRNYLPQLGLLLPLVHYGLGGDDAWLRWRRLALLVFALWLAAITGLRADNWGSLQQFSVAHYQNHPQSPRSNYQMGRVYASLVEGAETEAQRSELFLKALQHFSAAGELAPEFKDGLFGMLVLYSSNGLQAPAALVADLELKLAEEVIFASDINQLSNLLRCVEDGVCRLDAVILGRLLQSALGNPTMTEAGRELLR